MPGRGSATGQAKHDDLPGRDLLPGEASVDLFGMRALVGILLVNVHQMVVVMVIVRRVVMSMCVVMIMVMRVVMMIVRRVVMSMCVVMIMVMRVVVMMVMRTVRLAPGSPQHP